MKITVYCGANSGSNKIYYNKAVELGNWIAQYNHQLVYGGGKVGLMGILADTVMAKEGYVTGVIPTFLKDREIAHPGISELITVENMSQRKNLIISLADVFIALPGGPGTLEEITEVISWSRIGKNDKPCILLNVDGYFNSLRAMYERMVQEGLSWNILLRYGTRYKEKAET